MTLSSLRLWGQSRTCIVVMGVQSASKMLVVDKPALIGVQLLKLDCKSMDIFRTKVLYQGVLGSFFQKRLTLVFFEVFYDLLSLMV